MPDPLAKTDVLPLTKYHDPIKTTPVPEAAAAETVEGPLIVSAGVDVDAVRGDVREVLTPGSSIVAVLAHEAGRVRGNGETVWYKLKEMIRQHPSLKGTTTDHLVQAMRQAGFPAWKAGEDPPASFDSITNTKFCIRPEGCFVAQMTEGKATKTPKGRVVIWLERRIDEFESQWEEKFAAAKTEYDRNRLRSGKTDAIVALQGELEEMTKEMINEHNRDYPEQEPLQLTPTLWSVTIPVFTRRGYEVTKDQTGRVLRVKDTVGKHVYEDRT